MIRPNHAAYANNEVGQAQYVADLNTFIDDSQRIATDALNRAEKAIEQRDEYEKHLCALALALRCTGRKHLAEAICDAVQEIRNGRIQR